MAFNPRCVDPERCQARTWAGGRGAQCTRARGDDGLCDQHRRDNKWEVHGKVDGPIPAEKLTEFQRFLARGKQLAIEDKPRKERAKAKRRKGAADVERGRRLSDLTEGEALWLDQAA